MATTGSAAATAAPSSSYTRPPLDACRLCSCMTAGEVIDAGGDLGCVHRACFIEWDRREEALEMSACARFPGDPREFWAELEIEGSPVAEAA